MFITKLGHYPIVLGLPWLELHDVAIQFSSRTLTFSSNYCQSNCNKEAITVPTIDPDTVTESETPLRIASLGAGMFTRTVKRDRLHVFSLSVHKIDTALQDPPPKKPQIETIIPPEYHHHLPLFSEVIANQLPPHRPYDHKIPLQHGFQPPFGPLYSLS